MRTLGKPESLIRHVTDRPGHDRRYALDCSKIRERLDFVPRTGFKEGAERTIRWYQEHRSWWEKVKSGAFREYYEKALSPLSPGCSGSIWVALSQPKVVFIGDLVMLSEPPFLGDCVIDSWLASLSDLAGRRWKDYTMVSGRDGIVGRDALRTMARLLERVESRLARIGGRSVAADACVALAVQLLRGYRLSRARREQALARFAFPRPRSGIGCYGDRQSPPRTLSPPGFSSRCPGGTRPPR